MDSAVSNDCADHGSLHFSRALILSEPTAAAQHRAGSTPGGACPWDAGAYERGQVQEEGVQAEWHRLNAIDEGIRGAELLQAQAAVDGVAPSELSLLRGGGVMLHIDMKEAPKGWMPGFTVDVREPGHEKAKQQFRVYVHSNGIARIGVADGTYGFAFLFSDMVCTTPEAEQAMDGMEVEVPDLPDKIVVNGAWVDLPPMQVHRSAGR